MTGQKGRGKVLDESVEVTGWERKHANKVLLGIKRRAGVGAGNGALQVLI